MQPGMLWGQAHHSALRYFMLTWSPVQICLVPRDMGLRLHSPSNGERSRIFQEVLSIPFVRMTTAMGRYSALNPIWGTLDHSTLPPSILTAHRRTPGANPHLRSTLATI